MPSSTPNSPEHLEGIGSLLSTVSGPSTDRSSHSHLPSHSAHSAPAELLKKIVASEEIARTIPNNPNKESEYGKTATMPHEGTHAERSNRLAMASTVTELTTSPKTGKGFTPSGVNPMASSLDRSRVDSSGQRLTTNQSVPVADNQNSLKAGLRGPTLLEDFILREKLTHFDHERIPERVVHARGSAAHGYFECYAPLTAVTKAAPFSEAKKRTPVFVRFSTVAGERGSADTVRDVRGFAVKFYTDEGNWDLVGNNIPVFFIQDAMKFPDLIHAVKPEPHFAMPQASSAHDTFWDFVSLMPESTHMLLWQMSDRAIPRSYRMMQGFGVHTFRLVNNQGRSVFCKFHWTPVAGTHSLAWDEAVKIAGADPDFHRRDLWEAIEAGAFPEWELGLQLFDEAQAEKFSFDILDATKIVPEERVPVVSVGRLVLTRNPDNFFAETEQVAFCTAHIIPGLDFTNDPLLQGRIHSYLDTQITRLGGVNFHEIPINAPLAPVHNNQRDGFHRQSIDRGRVAYEPNSLAGGCPFQAGLRGFTSFPEAEALGEGDKVRGKPERFADHYSQATLFWRSQTLTEKHHIINAFRFELTRVQTPAIRERVVSMLVNVDAQLAQGVANGLGIEVPEAMPLASHLPKAEYSDSPALSLFSRPGDGSIRTRHIAILVSDGIEGESVRSVYAALANEGAAPRFVGAKLGAIQPQSGDPIEVEVSMEAAPAVLFDALVIPDGTNDSISQLIHEDQTLDFVREQYRHCKPILALGSATKILDAAHIHSVLGGVTAPGLIAIPSQEVRSVIPQFIEAIAQHRHFEREVLESLP